jgi:hypothetical protein
VRIRPVALSLCCAIGLAAPALSAAEEPPYVEVAAYLPPLAGTYQPSAEDDCTSGKPKCVDKVIREMYRRFDPQARSCDHASIFALTYLRTTEEYQRASLTPGFFADPYFVNHEDAVFARFYFDAYDNWKANRRNLVPRAWRIALDAGAEKRVSTTGNVLLGVNAHINRDLPYVLAGIGLVKPDGSSRKPDHDKVNQFLNKVADDLYPELARRFDPTVDDGNLPGYLDDMASFQSFPAMREAAWRNAEALVNASTPTARAIAEAQIENSAATTANAIVAATAYAPLSGGSAARDAYCAAHHDD